MTNNLILIFWICGAILLAQEKPNKQPPPIPINKEKAYFSHEIVDHCPFGHTTIKHVPILYGLIDNNQYSKLKDKINKLEIALGGCVVDTNQLWEIICTDCRYKYSVQDSVWFKTVVDEFEIDSFMITPDSVSLTIYNSIKDSLQFDYYLQEIKGGKIYKDEFGFIGKKKNHLNPSDYISRILDEGINVLKKEDNSIKTEYELWVGDKIYFITIQYLSFDDEFYDIILTVINKKI